MPMPSYIKGDTNIIALPLLLRALELQEYMPRKLTSGIHDLQAAH